MELLHRAKDRLGKWVEGYPVRHPFGKVFIVHYRHMTPMWTEVDPQTLQRVEEGGKP